MTKKLKCVPSTNVIGYEDEDLVWRFSPAALHLLFVEFLSVSA